MKNINKKTKRAILAFIFATISFLFFGSDSVFALNPGTDIQVCCGDNPPAFWVDTESDPYSPTIYYSVQGNPFYYHDIRIYKGGSLVYSTGIAQPLGSFYYSYGGDYSNITGFNAYPRCPCDLNPNASECSGAYASPTDITPCYDWAGTSTGSSSWEEKTGQSCSSTYMYDESMYGYTHCGGFFCSDGWCGTNASGCSVTYDSWGWGTPYCTCCTDVYETFYSYWTNYHQYLYNRVAHLLPATTYSHRVPPGYLQPDGSIYDYYVSAYGYYGDWTPLASASFILSPIDGACGTSSGSTTYCPNGAPNSLPSLPRPELCLRYDRARPPANTLTGGTSDSDPWNWMCYGAAGGVDSPLCTATPAEIIHGQCGSELTSDICSDSSPSSDPNLLCAQYDPLRLPSVNGSGTASDPWRWTCSANCNQVSEDASCERIATPRIEGVCGSASGQSYCYEDTSPDISQLCSPNDRYAGDLSNDYTEWTWHCNGACGGSTPTCHAGNSRSCGWRETN